MVFHHFPNHFIDPDDHFDTVSPVYSHSPGSPLPHLAIIPTRSTTSTSSPLISPTSPLPILRGPFPSPLLPPEGLQIRLRDQDAVHAVLDSALLSKAQNASQYESHSQPQDTDGYSSDEENGERVRGPLGPAPMLDEARMVAKGRFEAVENEDELREREAVMALDWFVRERTPYVKLASERLQAVFGEKNSMGFELPEVPLNMTPSFGRRLSTSSGPSNNNLSPSSSNNNNRRKDSGISMHQQSQQRSPLSPISPFGFHQVDEKTGNGLREWLLRRGKETGTQRKRGCRSISFHDFTPDMRTGLHANILVAHYNGGGLHERTDVYEVDLPTTYTDPTTNLPTQGIQTWLWFLISRPMISICPTETNTDPAISYSWKPNNYRSSPPSTIRPPPDFPMPIPTSYVVFACPASNVTEYPDCKDDSAPCEPRFTAQTRSHIQGMAPSYLTSHPHPYPRHTRTASSSPTVKKIYKRKDYDFSFQGIPLFEFSSSTFSTSTFSLLNVPTRATFEILSIDNLGSWYPSDRSGLCSMNEYQTRERAWIEEMDSIGKEERKLEERAGREREKEDPHARLGMWWEKFYQGVYREEGRWRRVKEAMSRGCCRVVVRWVESEVVTPTKSSSGFGGVLKKHRGKTSPLMDFSEDGEGDSDMSDAGFDDGLGLGIDLPGRERSASGSGRKIRERIAGRRISNGGQARFMRSEASRRSGLGVFATSQENVVGSGVLIGISGGHGNMKEGVSEKLEGDSSSRGGAKEKRY
ncbi:uncharacterized protein RAG0_12998 [Rhynchosporium agropyri]|uniref:Uncharacterized protein n=1 Tax=Rhynchosporium agropyri TaxID=914238 RepID=A0A1E1LAI3_9HELO|nr:uncharacterized protein RAG0_12998 [Rhynchosporium agropyri]